MKYTHDTDEKPVCLNNIYEKDEDENLEECKNCWWRAGCIIEAEHKNN